MLALIALSIFLIGLFLLWQSGQRRRASGMPGGRLVYSDTSQWNKQEEPLYDPELGLTGKPDYLFEDGDSLIPVEVKSSNIPHGPYDAHIFQLAAYCLLIKRVIGVRPPYGILHYTGRSQSERSFVVDFTPELEQNVIQLLAEMRAQDRRKEVHRSHQSDARCRACGYRSICEQRLE